MSNNIQFVSLILMKKNIGRIMQPKKFNIKISIKLIKRKEIKRKNLIDWLTDWLIHYKFIFIRKTNINNNITSALRFKI